MLKGITFTYVVLCTVMCPFSTSGSVKESRYFILDTTKVISTPAASQINLTQPTLKIPEETTNKAKIDAQAHLDSVLSKSDQRDKLVLLKKTPIPKEEIIINPEDTSSIRIYNDIPAYQHQRTALDEIYNNNFFLAIPNKTISQHFDTSLLRKYGISQVTKTIPMVETPLHFKEKTGFVGVQRAKSSKNWLPGILLFSLFAFSWVKILYQKYVYQVVISVLNYQVSLRLLREKNVLFRNMAFVLNLVFALNVGLFIFFCLQYFGITQINHSNITSILIYSTGVIILFNIKTFICRVLGYIFKVQDEFAEYTHNIHLFNKNIGLFLFPIIVIFPYISITFKPIVLYLGILVISIMFFLLMVRGFQIIMRKGVSLFYLILYLCAIEILPVLIVVKYSATMI